MRSHEPRRVGSRRGRRHEAVRLHALQARPGTRRPLPPGRSVLPRLEGARVRLLHRVHRAGREGQREHAVLLPREDHASAERSGAFRPRQPGAPRGRLLQGGRGRPARVAGAEADRAATRRGRRDLLHRRTRATAARARARLGRARRRGSGARTASSSSLRMAASTTRRSPRRPASWSTFATPRARRARRTATCGSCSRAGRARPVGRQPRQELQRARPSEVALRPRSVADRPAASSLSRDGVHRPLRGRSSRIPRSTRSSSRRPCPLMQSSRSERCG